MKCPDCGEEMVYMAGETVCLDCDAPMNKTMEDDKWIQGDKDDSNES